MNRIDPAQQSRQMEERYAAFSDFGNQKAYVDYLQQGLGVLRCRYNIVHTTTSLATPELQDARQEHDRLKEEIRTKVMQQIKCGHFNGKRTLPHTTPCLFFPATATVKERSRASCTGPSAS
jgi:hypothetical protein